MPQLLLLRQTTVPTVIDSFYLVALGSYRFLYILNWILRAIKERGELDPIFPIQVICGIIQTALYIDFAYVYWFRQRVKLRGGAVVDSQDLQRGWLVNKILGQRGFAEDEDEDGEEREGLARQEEGNGGVTRPTNRWGARGISVSADDGLEENGRNGHAVSPGGKDAMTDPDVFEDDFDADEEEEGESGVAEAAQQSGVSGGEEWRDGK